MRGAPVLPRQGDVAERRPLGEELERAAEWPQGNRGRRRRAGEREKRFPLRLHCTELMRSIFQHHVCPPVGVHPAGAVPPRHRLPPPRGDHAALPAPQQDLLLLLRGGGGRPKRTPLLHLQRPPAAGSSTFTKGEPNRRSSSREK